MENEYKKMMLWVLAALVASIVTASIIVEWVMRTWGAT
jgi:hypothetical protein